MSRAQQLRLNWSRPSQLRDAWEVLNEHQQQRLDRVWSKPDHCGRLRREFGLPRHRYLTQGSIYAMSHWDHADSYSLCGYRFGDGHIHDCGLWKFCPRCSHRRKWNMQCQFALCFRDAAWKFLTISFSGDIEEFDLGLCSLGAYWDAARLAVTTLQGMGCIRGCVWREELEIRSYQPLRLRPHLHAMANAPTLDATAVRTLMGSARFQQLWTRARKPSLFPDAEATPDEELNVLLARLDVDCRETPTAKAFRNRLSYMQKEIKLLTPYRAAVKDSGVDAHLSFLNREVERSLHLFARATRNRKQSGSTGIMHPLSPDYIGVPRALLTPQPAETPEARQRRERHYARIQRLLSGSA